MRPGRGLSGAVVRRSWLLVPVSDERQVAEASSSGADVAVLDLVEFVPEKDKPRARVLVKEAIASVSRGGAEVFVQVEPDLLHADLHASVWPGLSGVLSYPGLSRRVRWRKRLGFCLCWRTSADCCPGPFR